MFRAPSWERVVVVVVVVVYVRVRLSTWLPSETTRQSEFTIQRCFGLGRFVFVSQRGFVAACKEKLVHINQADWPLIRTFHDAVAISRRKLQLSVLLQMPQLLLLRHRCMPRGIRGPHMTPTPIDAAPKSTAEIICVPLGRSPQSKVKSIAFQLYLLIACGTSTGLVFRWGQRSLYIWGPWVIGWGARLLDGSPWSPDRGVIHDIWTGPVYIKCHLMGQKSNVELPYYRTAIQHVQ